MTEGRPFSRLHPLTPVLRGWTWLAAVGLVGAQQLQSDLGPRASLAGLALLVVAAALVGSASWWFTRYRIEGDHLRLETGLVFRQSRRVRLDRLQAVDVVRPLLARVLGLAELRLEVVGGTSAEARLAYLSESEAQRLRAEMLARAAGLAPEEPEAPERVLVEVSPGRLLASVLLRLSPLLLVVVTSFLVMGVTLGRVAVAGLVPLLIATGGQFYATFVRQFGFTVAESPDGLRLRAGLLDTRAQTVPPGRVQAVRVSRPLSWRLFTDWALLEVNVAGYGGKSAASSSLLLPVGTPREIAALLAPVLPGLDLSTLPLVPAGRRARWIRPIGWQRLAAGVGGAAFVAQRGLLRSELVIVPHAKAQSLRLTQGPYQRRLGLATLHVDSTPGPVRPIAPHRDVTEAAALLAAETEAARRARAVATKDRWMAPPHDSARA